jgi:hypothetical protein
LRESCVSRGGRFVGEQKSGGTIFRRQTKRWWYKIMIVSRLSPPPYPGYYVLDNIMNYDGKKYAVIKTYLNLLYELKDILINSFRN